MTTIKSFLNRRNMYAMWVCMPPDYDNNNWSAVEVGDIVSTSDASCSEIDYSASFVQHDVIGNIYLFSIVAGGRGEMGDGGVGTFPAENLDNLYHSEDVQEAYAFGSEQDLYALCATIDLIKSAVPNDVYKLLINAARIVAHAR